MVDYDALLAHDKEAGGYLETDEEIAADEDPLRTSRRHGS